MAHVAPYGRWDAPLRCAPHSQALAVERNMITWLSIFHRRVIATVAEHLPFEKWAEAEQVLQALSFAQPARLRPRGSSGKVVQSGRSPDFMSGSNTASAIGSKCSLN